MPEQICLGFVKRLYLLKRKNNFDFFKKVILQKNWWEKFESENMIFYLILCSIGKKSFTFWIILRWRYTFIECLTNVCIIDNKKNTWGLYITYKIMILVIISIFVTFYVSGNCGGKTVETKFICGRYILKFEHLTGLLF